jgi:hypothetical protein
MKVRSRVRGGTQCARGLRWRRGGWSTDLSSAILWSIRRAMASVRAEPPGTWLKVWKASRQLGVVVGEVAGKFAVGVDLGEEVPGLLLDGGDRVGSCDPPPRRVFLLGRYNEGSGDLRGVACRTPIHAVPSGDGLLRTLRVVVDRGLGIPRRFRSEQLGAEKPWHTHACRNTNPRRSWRGQSSAYYDRCRRNGTTDQRRRGMSIEFERAIEQLHGAADESARARRDRSRPRRGGAIGNE